MLSSLIEICGGQALLENPTCANSPQSAVWQCHEQVVISCSCAHMNGSQGFLRAWGADLPNQHVTSDRYEHFVHCTIGKTLGQPEVLDHGAPKTVLT